MAESDRIGNYFIPVSQAKLFCLYNLRKPIYQIK